MEFFLDTSVLFKLFIQEESSDHYLEILREGPAIYVSNISWVEFHSAIKKRSTIDLTAGFAHKALDEFRQEWEIYSKIDLSEDVLQSAAHLVSKHGLRTLDSIQLASAKLITFLRDEPVLFLSANHKLEAAARREKLKTRI